MALYHCNFTTLNSQQREAPAATPQVSASSSSSHFETQVLEDLARRTAAQYSSTSASAASTKAHQIHLIIDEPQQQRDSAATSNSSKIPLPRIQQRKLPSRAVTLPVVCIEKFAMAVNMWKAFLMHTVELNSVLGGSNLLVPPTIVTSGVEFQRSAEKLAQLKDSVAPLVHKALSLNLAMSYAITNFMAVMLQSQPGNSTTTRSTMSSSTACETTIMALEVPFIEGSLGKKAVASSSSSRNNFMLVQSKLESLYGSQYQQVLDLMQLPKEFALAYHNPEFAKHCFTSLLLKSYVAIFIALKLRVNPSTIPLVLVSCVDYIQLPQLVISTLPFNMWFSSLEKAIENSTLMVKLEAQVKVLKAQNRTKYEIPIEKSQQLLGILRSKAVCFELLYAIEFKQTRQGTVSQPTVAPQSLPHPLHPFSIPSPLPIVPIIPTKLSIVPMVSKVKVKPVVSAKEQVIDVEIIDLCDDDVEEAEVQQVHTLVADFNDQLFDSLAVDKSIHNSDKSTLPIPSMDTEALLSKLNQGQVAAEQYASKPIGEQVKQPEPTPIITLKQQIVSNNPTAISLIDYESEFEKAITMWKSLIEGIQIIDYSGTGALEKVPHTMVSTNEQFNQGFDELISLVQNDQKNELDSVAKYKALSLNLSTSYAFATGMTRVEERQWKIKTTNGGTNGNSSARKQPQQQQALLAEVIIHTSNKFQTGVLEKVCVDVHVVSLVKFYIAAFLALKVKHNPAYPLVQLRDFEPNEFEYYTNPIANLPLREWYHSLEEATRDTDLLETLKVHAMKQPYRLKLDEEMSNDLQDMLCAKPVGIEFISSIPRVNAAVPVDSGTTTSDVQIDNALTKKQESCNSVAENKGTGTKRRPCEFANSSSESSYSEEECLEDQQEQLNIGPRKLAKTTVDSQPTNAASFQ